MDKKIFQIGKIFASVMMFISFALPFASVRYFGISISASGFDYLFNSSTFNLTLGAWFLFLGTLALIAYSVIDLLDTSGNTKVLVKYQESNVNVMVYVILGISLLGILLIIIDTMATGVVIALLAVLAFAALHFYEKKNLNA